MHHDPVQFLPADLGWLYLPAVFLVGVLHGFEPGHSKAMTAAFILAIRATLRQAVLLGLCTALAHTCLIGLVLAAVLRFRHRFNMGEAEPVFRVVAGLMIMSMACWMFFRIREVRKREGPALLGKYSDRPVGPAQVMLFGLTGGLILCPSSIAVLLLCLQSGKLCPGPSEVTAFGAGLAATLVSVACSIAWGTGHALKRFQSSGKILSKLPYLSVVILIVLGLCVTGRGILKLLEHGVS